MSSSSALSTVTATASGSCVTPSTFTLQDITPGSATNGVFAHAATYSSDTPQSHVFLSDTPDIFNFLTTSYYTNILLDGNSQDIYIQPDIDGADFPPLIAFTTPGDYVQDCQFEGEACILNCNTTSGYTDFVLAPDSGSTYALHMIKPSATIPSGAIRATFAAQTAVATPTPTNYTNFALEVDTQAPFDAGAAVVYLGGHNLTLLSGTDYDYPGESGFTIDPDTNHLTTVHPIVADASEVSVAYIDTTAESGYSVILMDPLPLAGPNLQPLQCMYPVYVFGAAVALVFLRALVFLVSSVRSPLRSVPGPLLARFTRLWYIKALYPANFEQTNIKLHRKYGPVVRLTPNIYSLDDPEAAKAIYGYSSQFPKSDWYFAWRHPDPGFTTIFSDQNIKRHAEQRRKYASAYSMSSMLSYESFVEHCGDLLCKRFEEFSYTGKSFDLANWLQCYAFDVVGEITYSKRFGFLDEGKDANRLIHTLESNMRYSTMAGVYSELHPLFFRIIDMMKGSKGDNKNYLLQFSRDNIAERAATLKTESVEDENAPTDMITKFLRAHQKDSENFTALNILRGSQSNIAAGSDTTAISLSSILYNLHAHPHTLARLRAEIASTSAAGLISDPVKFKESQERMPYLLAVIKEGMRIHPAVGLPLLRVVPPGGAHLCGKFFPEGTVVGINSWVAHRNKTVFGADADVFRPERWLDADKDKVAEMERYNMTFGGGARTCIGRHISYLEMSKVVPQLVRKFDFQLDIPKEGLKTRSYWFTKHRNLFARVRRRGEEVA
ncbi:MAG: hypothetical protein Q9227_000484 [Pyrenula ochraceoflavens]